MIRKLLKILILFLLVGLYFFYEKTTQLSGHGEVRIDLFIILPALFLAFFFLSAAFIVRLLLRVVFALILVGLVIAAVSMMV